MAINKVGSKGIEDGSVATADLADNVVTSAKLGDGEVTNAKLANTTVTLAGESVALGASLSLTNKFVDWQTVITAAGSSNTAVSGQGYFIDTTSAVHTVTLPASAAIGDFIAIKDYAGTFNTNNLTIARNGHNIQGVANDSLISTNRASLVLVYVDATKGWLYWEEHNVADLEKTLYITATGGTITTSGDFKIHTFTGDGCFVVSQAGAGAGPSEVDYLVVGGGGAGGACIAPTYQAGGGGGGAGGYREGKGGASGCYTASPLASSCGITVTSTTYPITVGAGGTGCLGCTPSGWGDDGSPSIFSTITSAGGGGGGGRGSSNGRPGGSGGGGGGSVVGSNYSAGSGNTPPVSPPQGNNGAPNSPNSSVGHGAGGGGAGGTGNSPPPSSGGSGGPGTTSNFSNSPVTYAAGASGATHPNSTGGSGTANTGNGGGGSEGPGGGAGNGGKGIVIIRYKFQ